MTEPIFLDRTAAGRELAARLSDYRHTSTLALALPRGGVPVAYEMAKRLELPLDVLMVRKLGIPGHEEFAMGAIASGGVSFVDKNVLHNFNISKETLEVICKRETRELLRREELYRRDRAPIVLKDRCVILVDDGLATGASMKVAIEAARQLGAKKIIAAVPVAPASALETIRPLVDEIICAATPTPFMAVGYWYEKFSQVSDDEVCNLLSLAWRSNKNLEVYF